jgi:putative peptidoglycan lipid II flippase
MARASFVRSAGIVSACTLLSRVLGLARDVLCSHFFGASAQWDAFAVAFRIPNLFRRLFGEGALTAAFLPAFVERHDAGRRAEARALLDALVTALTLFLGAVVLAGIGVTFLLPKDAENLLFARLLRIMLPYLPLICVAAVLGAALNGTRHYFTPAFAPVLLNVVWIAALFLFPRRIEAIAWAVLLGGALELAVLVLPLQARGISPRPSFDLREPALAEVGRRFVPMVFGLALVQVNEVVGSILAKEFVPGDGAVSALYYGNQLTQLPLALIGTAIATAVFPLLTSPKEDFRDVFGRSLRLTLFVALPATVGLMVLARPIVRLLFEHGHFTPEDTRRTAGVVVLYSAGLWCYCANQIQARAFYGRKDATTPARVSAAMVLLNFALSLALLGPLGERGIALANSATGLATFAALQWIFRRRHGGVPLGPLARSLARSLAASAAMGALAWGAARLLEAPPGATIAARAVAALVPVAAGAAAYFLLARLFGMEEARWLLRRPAPPGGAPAAP